jgi:hypothetical protein
MATGARRLAPRVVSYGGLFLVLLWEKEVTVEGDQLPFDTFLPSVCRT